MKTHFLDGIPGTTIKITSSDTAQSLASLISGGAVSGKDLHAVLITVETNDIRFALGGTTPVIASATGHHLAAGESIKLNSASMVNTFSFINKTAGNNAILQVTAEYV